MAQSLLAFCVAVFLGTLALLPHAPAVGVPSVARAIDVPAYQENETEASLADLLGSGPVLADAGAMRDYCASASPGGSACFESALARLLQSDGNLTHVFRVLDELSVGDQTLQLEQHNIAHSLGRVALSVIGNVTSAMQQCPDGMASGCVHGVLETYFGNQATVDATTVRGICGEPQDGSAGGFRVFNCLHGLGHGLDLYAGHDWFRALQLCDGLGGSWSQQSCYGGVFMENIVADQDALRGGHIHNHDVADPVYPRLNDSDMNFPCDVVAAKYLMSCYLLQTSVVFHFHPNDWAAGFAMCQAAPVDDKWICDESMGRDVSGATVRNGTRTLATCATGPDEDARDHCLIGAVKDYLNTDAAMQSGVDLCKRADDFSPVSCWTGVGQMAGLFVPDHAARLAACAPAGDLAWACAGDPPPAAGSVQG